MTPQPTAAAASARRDFRVLWAGQSLNLLGDHFMVLTLPLLAVTVIGASASQAALLPFALFVPFLLFGLPAGAIVDRLPRRLTMILCDALQAAIFLTIAALAAASVLSLPWLLVLVALAGTATLFFQVAYTSYLPELFPDGRDLQRGNARLFFSESVSRTLGPVLAGPVIAILGPVVAVAANAGSFVLSVLSIAAIRHREPARAPRARKPGWMLDDIREGLRFVFGHSELEPVILCGAVYVLFLSMIEASLVLYCRHVLGLGPTGCGVVVGAAALGFPIGNVLSSRLVDRLGVASTLVASACVSVTGLVLIPVAGSTGSAVALVAASVLHGAGEGAFGPTSLTLRQTVTPPHLLGRINAVQRFLLWGTIPLGSLIASLTIELIGLRGAVWIGGLGTCLCLPVLLRRGIRDGLAQRWAAARGRALSPCPSTPTGAPSAPEED
ncbi:MAG TPA: MFS transporter [Polyangium sp.]|nr:MFS transporter [Polyangium sp.]